MSQVSFIEHERLFYKRQVRSTGTLSRNINFTMSTGNWSWTCQSPPSSTVSCSAHLQCAHGFTYDNSNGNCRPASCTTNANCATGYTCVSGTCSNGGSDPIGGGGGCFVAGTPVLLESGEQKSIETIQVGDRVATYNELSGEVETDEIVEILHHEMALQHLFTFELEDGTSFTANDIHPMYIKSVDYYLSTREIYTKWLQKENVKLYAVNGEELAILNISYSYEFVPVYNLHVKGHGEMQKWKGNPAGHNYYVNGVLVHNANGRQLLSPLERPPVAKN